jgi:SAM-dependent methyltransferase
MQKLTTEKPNIDTSIAWESYWSKTSNLSTPILWDSNPKVAAVVDLPRFQKFMDAQLPLIDFACGNGTQTRFLADYFSQVIGVDVSKSALEMAQAQNNAPNISYSVLDALLPEQAVALHSELGDANIYMRTGFHHIPCETRSEFAHSLQILLGTKGILYLIELGAEAIHYFNSLIEQYGKPPHELGLVLEHGIRPGTVTAEDIALLFPDFEVLTCGEDLFHTIHKLPNGDCAKVPAFYATIRHK